MMIDTFVCDVLMIRQSQFIAEPAIAIHKLKVHPGLISKWIDFLVDTIPPLDYVFGRSLCTIMEREIQGYIKNLKRMSPDLNDFNRSLADKHVTLFQTAETYMKMSYPDVCSRWVNTGVYESPHRAWLFYIHKLAACMEYASHVRLFIDVGCMRAGDAGKRYGMLLGELCSISAMMSPAE